MTTTLKAGTPNAAKSLKLPEIQTVKFQPPAGERLTLKNGIKVYYIQDSTLPLIRIQALIRTGKMYDPKEKAGLGSITMNLIRDGGTEKYSAENMDKILENLGASIDTEISLEEATVNMTSLSKDFTEVLDIFAQVMRKPVFEADKVAIQKAEELEVIERRFDNPGQSVVREALRHFFGTKHPYGFRTEKETINAITIDDMKAWHKNYFQPGNIMLAVAGDFGDAKNLEDKLNSALGDWAKGSTYYPRLPFTVSQPLRTVYHMQKDSAQAYIVMIQTGPKRLSPEEYALSVTNEMLGGGLSSRLAAEVRSRRGLAYTVYSYAGKRELEGFEMAYCGTKPSTAGEAIETMLAEFKKIQKETAEAEEVERAKASIINSFVFRFPTPFSLITNRMVYDYYNYPSDYLENYVSNIEKIDAAAVQDSAKRIFRPDNMIIFVIGDASKFDKPLSTFGRVVELKEED
ncbi:MAG: insulinase family protein [Elusimicrobiales bacterium]|nr:insulinase family protein [Elusimicrobiales bacterium]